MEKKFVKVGFGVLLWKDSKVLLGKRHDDAVKASSELHGEGTWTMPGGKMHFQESFEDAAKRELEEETGIIGASFIIILFTIFLWRGLAIAKQSPDLLGRLLASGISVWIFLEAFINMSVLVNLLPFAGNALPFISYGGSSLTMVLVGVGIIMSVARQTAIKTNQEEGRPLNAVVSLRRNDGWRSVSRTRRPSSTRK